MAEMMTRAVLSQATSRKIIEIQALPPEGPSKPGVVALTIRAVHFNASEALALAICLQECAAHAGGFSNEQLKSALDEIGRLGLDPAG